MGDSFAAAGAAALALIAWLTFAQAAIADDFAPTKAVINADVRRSLDQYQSPNVILVRDDGKSVNLAAELDDGRPVMMNFVYTSCATICPMSSQTFEQFQDSLGAWHERVHLLSISIDPEQDRPAQLRAYALKFHAKSGWDHYTGSLAAIVAVQRAFNAYRGDKMSHIPLTLVRSSPGEPWVRFEGFAQAEDLILERKKWTMEAPMSQAARLVQPFER